MRLCVRAHRNGKKGNQMRTIEAMHIKHSRPAQMCKLCLVLCIVIVCNFCQLGSHPASVCTRLASGMLLPPMPLMVMLPHIAKRPRLQSSQRKKIVRAFRFRRRFVVVVIVIAIVFYISFLAPVWSFLFSGSQ